MNAMPTHSSPTPHLNRANSYPSLRPLSNVTTVEDRVIGSPQMVCVYPPITHPLATAVIITFIAHRTNHEYDQSAVDMVVSRLIFACRYGSSFPHLVRVHSHAHVQTWTHLHTHTHTHTHNMLTNETLLPEHTRPFANAQARGVQHKSTGYDTTLGRHR